MLTFLNLSINFILAFEILIHESFLKMNDFLVSIKRILFDFFLEASNRLMIALYISINWILNLLRIFQFFILFRLKLINWFHILLVNNLLLKFQMFIFNCLIFLDLMLFLALSIFFHIDFILRHSLNLINLMIRWIDL